MKTDLLYNGLRRSSKSFAYLALYNRTSTRAISCLFTLQRPALGVKPPTAKFHVGKRMGFLCWNRVNRHYPVSSLKERDLLLHRQVGAKAKLARMQVWFAFRRSVSFCRKLQLLSSTPRAEEQLHLFLSIFLLASHVNGIFFYLCTVCIVKISRRIWELNARCQDLNVPLVWNWNLGKSLFQLTFVIIWSVLAAGILFMCALTMLGNGIMTLPMIM